MSLPRPVTYEEALHEMERGNDVYFIPGNGEEPIKAPKLLFGIDSSKLSRYNLVQLYKGKWVAIKR